jgi:hypothetical protein
MKDACSKWYAGMTFIQVAVGTFYIKMTSFLLVFIKGSFHRRLAAYVVR